MFISWFVSFCLRVVQSSFRALLLLYEEKQCWKFLCFPWLCSQNFLVPSLSEAARHVYRREPPCTGPERGSHTDSHSRVSPDTAGALAGCCSCACSTVVCVCSLVRNTTCCIPLLKVALKAPGSEWTGCQLAARAGTPGHDRGALNRMHTVSPACATSLVCFETKPKRKGKEGKRAKQWINLTKSKK